MAIETFIITAPSYWASFLVNGDASGLTNDEVYEAEVFFRGLSVLSCEEEYISTFRGVKCSVCDYVVTPKLPEE